jgi:hypothetical protein
VEGNGDTDTDDGSGSDSEVSGDRASAVIEVLVAVETVTAPATAPAFPAAAPLATAPPARPSPLLLQHRPADRDLIFIDGLHEATQVYRDFENAVQILNTGGTIVFLQPEH